MGWKKQLDAVLSEDVHAVRERERTAFDRQAGQLASSLVLYGAGNLGRKVLDGLRRNGVEPRAFADGNPALAGKSVDGTPVFSPTEAAHRFGKTSAFVVCVWHPALRGIGHISDDLAGMGVEHAIPFPLLFWKYPETFLPYYLWDLPSKFANSSESILRACACLADDESREHFAAQLRFRNLADFSVLPAPSPGPQYFPGDLFELRQDECFVDCGAYNGDTIRDFVQHSNGAFRRIIAFEPDTLNVQTLKLLVEESEQLRNRTSVYHAALGRQAGKLRFAMTGQGNASVSSNGNTIVDCSTLDEALGDEIPTFIKMDIEGAEEEALLGGQDTIRAHHPKLALCLYHRQSDLWTLPLLMNELEPESALSLRSYWADGFDLVCYAVPPQYRRP